MTIKIPSVRNQRGATTADIIVEQVALCESNLKNIEEIAFFRKEREINDEINRRLRCCHTFLGMAGSRKLGCLYREVGLTEEDRTICEHVIPVSGLASLYENGVQFEKLVFYPVALITKTSDKRFRELGLVKTGHDPLNIFRRYCTANIKIETHERNEIDTQSWTIDDHWSLVESTPQISNIKIKVHKKLQLREHNSSNK